MNNIFIICAAIYYNDGIKRMHLPRNIKTGIVAAEWRHGNCLTILNAIFPNREYLNNRKTTIQGFLTSEGNFVDWIETGKIAFEAGQVDKPNDYLFSEDLY